MHLRAPNLGIFILAAILTIIGLVEYLGVPLSIPTVSFSIPGLSFLNLSAHILSTSDVLSFLNVNAFWLVFLGWVLLAIGTVASKRRSSAQAHLGEVISDSGRV